MRGARLKWLGRFAGRTARAEERCEEADAEALLREGCDREWIGDAAGAEQRYRRIVEADPSHAEAHYRLGRIAEWDRRREEAAAHFERAAELAPREALYHYALGNALFALRAYAEAAEVFARCVALQPSCTDMQINHAGALIEANRREEARAVLERLRAAQPEVWQAHFNLGGIYREYGRIADAVACYRRCLALAPGYAAARSNLLLIMNYGAEYSADEIFREHRRFGEEFARRCVPPPADAAWPRRLRIGYVSPDLRGHVVSYFLEPLLANHDHASFEIFCYRPAPLTLPPGPSPARGEGTLTFGCFNNFPKVSGAFVDAAARVLGALPGARLLMKARPLSVASVAEGLRTAFAARGVDPARLDLRGWEAGYRDHLRIYHEVDIALDTFPYNGATTTCEALWMGVPVVSLAGDRHAGRMGASLLNAAGVAEFVVRDADEYVAKCVELAREPARLRALRSELRSRMQRSALMDEAGFARRVEDLYREMWEEFLRPRRAVAAAVPAGLLEQARHLMAEGNLSGADEAVRRVLEAQPADVEALALLCRIAFDAGSPGAAIAPLERAIAAGGAPAVVHYMLGAVLQEQGKLEDAIASLRRAVELDPGLAKAHNNLGCALELAGRMPEAIACFREAVRLDPSLAQAHYNLGNAHRQAGDAAEAMRSIERALALDPAQAEWRCNLAGLQIERWQLDEAIGNFRRAIASDPACARAHLGLGAALLMTGCVEEALQALAAAQGLAPDPATESWVLFVRHYREDEEPQALAAAHRDWAARHCAVLPRSGAHAARRRAARRRLNIGYVSPDFRRHPVANFIAPVLGAHDRGAFRVFCYASGPRDRMTERLRAMADCWRDISAVSDEVAAERIRCDGIDILVDLAGHTAGGRLLLFARKPAPVQATWIGYPNTTGLETMDYRITDPIADPPGRSDALYGERLVRLPDGFLCYAPPEEAPAVVEPPALARGRVTFGCFGTLPKLTPVTISLWAQVLHALPDSRLLLKAYGFASAQAQAALRQRFGVHGIGAERLVLSEPEESYARHLARYGEIDIALDTFPYNGTTTTCEALWMGVPVVTLAGEVHRSRVGASLAAAASLPGLVAETPARFVEIALALARDLEGLRALRRGMRERLRETALFDAVRFTRRLEDEYRRMAERDVIGAVPG